MLCVCEHCLCGIESHEGKLFYRHASEEDLQNPIYSDEYPFDTFGVCEWCEEETLIDDLYIIGD